MTSLPYLVPMSEQWTSHGLVGLTSVPVTPRKADTQNKNTTDFVLVFFLLI